MHILFTYKKKIKMISINEICLFPYFDSSLSLFYGLKICYVRHHEMVFTSYIPLSFPIKKKKCGVKLFGSSIRKEGSVYGDCG